MVSKNNRSNEIETQAPTAEQAITKGLEQFGTTKDKVEIKILDEGSSGLFGLMGAKPAIVSMKLKKIPASENSQPEPRRQGADTPDLRSTAQGTIEQILRLMGTSYTAMKVNQDNNTVQIDIETPESAILIGKQGRTLRSLQFLVNIIVARTTQANVAVELDINGYEQHCVERLTGVAKQGADEVRKIGTPKKLQPMTAHDRRIVHMALKEDPDVETVSQGDGPFRSVIIKPKSS